MKIDQTLPRLASPRVTPLAAWLPLDTFTASATVDSHRKRNAAVGAGLGAASGALLHVALGSPRLLASTLIGTLAGAALGAVLSRARDLDAAAAKLSIDDIRKLPEYGWEVPTRAQQIERLKDPAANFDVIVIGGGATGAGAALEAARRGLKVAMLEGGDFACGTSSRSTKLIHGGVRYLEAAVKHLDREQYDLVKEGLEERKSFLRMAPHLTDELRLVTPCYRWWEVPYYFVGLWLYDRIAGREALSATRILSSKATQAQLPGVKSQGLRGAVVYSDGEFNDARMNVSLALTAAASGAAVANYVRVEGLLRDGGKVVGVQVKDGRSGDTWEIRGKTVINAAGPYIDHIRKMDDAKAEDLVVPSAGTHIFVKRLQMAEGVLVPKAPNGSVAFFKPFEGGTLIGTTEEPTTLTHEPNTTRDQVEYLRDLANHYLDPAHQIQPQDISAVWTGIRPLVRDPDKPAGAKGTVTLSRKHIIEVSPGGLITIGGGKWTSFGRMAQDVVDAAIQRGGLPNVPTQRPSTRVIGAHGWSPDLARQLTAQFGLEPAVADHLARSYGDRAIRVAEIAAQGYGQRLHAEHPYLEAEVIYGARHEYAVDAVDVLSRRTRLSFIDEPATHAVLPRVVELMAQVHGWDANTAATQLAQSRAYLQRNGMSAL